MDADPVMPAPAAVEEPACGLGGDVGRRHQGPPLTCWERSEDLTGLRDQLCGEEEVLHEDPGTQRDDRRERGLEVVLHLAGGAYRPCARPGLSACARKDDRSAHASLLRSRGGLLRALGGPGVVVRP